LAQRDLQFAGELLQGVLFPPEQDRVHRRRNGDIKPDDEAPSARRRRVLPVPARASRTRGVKQLVITADDFGAAPEVNEAVEIAHRDGILTATSLMVSAPAADDAVARARRLPFLRVGLHLVLVEGRPALPASEIPDLVAGDGTFRTDMARAGAAMFFLL